MQVIYGALRAMGVIDGPAAFRQLRAAGPRTPEQMIDRYHLACQPVRDLLVDYLRERQPALDYSTLQQLGYELGKLFWADIEQHYPGISGIHLPDDVARAWKQRLQVKDGSGGAAQAGTERISARHCLTTVRAFYLDIAQWALDDPSRWARWAVPCPVRPQEISRRKVAQHRKSRMDARTRERLPVLPALASAIDRQRKDAAALLAAARQAAPGQEFTAAGRTLARLPVRGGSPLKVWARTPPPASAPTSPSRKATRSGPGRPSRCSATPASGSRSSSSSATTAWSSTGFPAPASSSRSCRSPRRRPTRNGSC